MNQPSVINDPGILIESVTKSRIPISFHYFTKTFLDTLPYDKIQKIDSSLSAKTYVHGIGLLKSSEASMSCRDNRIDRVSVFRVVGDDTTEMRFKITKYLRNGQESWGGTSTWADNSYAGPVCTFSKVLKLSLYEKPADTFFIRLDTDIPTMGAADTYRYLWKVVLGGNSQAFITP